MRLRGLHDLLFEFITGEIGRGADVWRVLDGVSTQVKYLGIVTARAGHCQHVRMTIWMTRAHRSRPRSRGAPWGGVSDMSGHHPGHSDISPGPWPCITRHKHQGWSPDYDPHQEKLYSNMRVKSNKRSVCVRRCFLIISVTIMNCFNVVNVVLVSWDQLPGPGELRSTLETNQWSSRAWSGWRHLPSAKHTAQTTGHGERASWENLIQNIFTSGWPQFVIKSDVN